MNMHKQNSLTAIASAGIAVVALILILSTVWMGQNAKNGTKSAVHSVSLLYLDELTGRREQVVANNLKDKTEVIRIFPTGPVNIWKRSTRPQSIFCI
ncbi:hypothetical protein ACTQ56_00190 [[Clostridium] aminophilum]|uniref:hypothetical protein n=1 Tax=[Clostridium] aminophilum TaxID=1526 RepID=UPI003F95207F